MAGLRSPRPSEEDDNQRLRSYLLRCTSAEIVAACRAVEGELQRHQYQTGEHVRDFYRLCFPILLRKILGFEDSQLASPQGSSRASATAASASWPVNALSGGWLADASLPGNEAQARALISLLSPEGPLFSSLLTADKESFVRYVFPTERLPEWVRQLMAADKGVFLLCQISPLWKTRIVGDALGAVQVHLDVFEYYMFWFAYYAVCKECMLPQNGPGGKRGRNVVASRSKQLRSQIEHWAASIPGLHQEKTPAPSGVQVNPYLHLLGLYLSHFLRFSGGAAVGRAAQQDTVSSSNTSSQGDILACTLIEFWLMDDDPVPISQKTRGTLGGVDASLGLKSLSAQVYVPPGNDLTDALKVLINYLNRHVPASRDPNSGHTLPESDSGGNLYRSRSVLGQAGTASPRSSSSWDFSTSAFLGNSFIGCLQRPLYRFFLRAFRLWPMGSSVRRMDKVINVWLDYLQPWNASKENSSRKLGSASGRSRLPDQQKRPVIPSIWNNDDLSPSQRSEMGNSRNQKKQQAYVLSNYLFYTQLVTHFLEFAIKNVHVDPEAILRMTYKVLAALAHSKELLVYLRRLDHAYSLQDSSKQLSGIRVELAQLIEDQLENWEEGFSAVDERENTEAERNQRSQFRFFTLGENGGHHLLQSLILRGEAEVQAATPERSPLIAQGLEAVKDITRIIFDSHAVASHYGSMMQPGFSPLVVNYLEEESTPSAQPSGLNRHSWMDVKYRGDWMRRPIEASEIAFLARFLVKLSDRINSALGLDDRHRACNYVPSAPPEPPAENGASGGLDAQAGDAGGLKHVLDFVRRRLWGYLLMLQRELQRRDVRVNLRFMAEQQFFVLVFLAICLYSILYFVASLIFVRDRGR